MAEKRKVKIVQRGASEVSERCPKCRGALTELLDVSKLPWYIDREFGCPGGLWCAHCALCFEWDGESGLLGEVKLWSAEDFPSGGGNAK